MNKSGYIKDFPKKRLLYLWLIFAPAVCIYLALKVYLKQIPQTTVFLKALIGWESVGNSNWYIFCILYLYFITWVTFGLAAFSDSDKKTNQARSLFPLIIITLLTITYILQMMIMKGADAGHWYNTALCYPAGMFYAYFQKDIDQFLLYDHRKWLLVLITTVAIFLSFYQYKSNIWVYEICAISFALIVIWISMRFSMNSRVYYWLGKNLFGLFILQRLPMIYFESTGLAAEHTHIFIYICFVLMILLASIYNKVISIIRR